MAKKSPYTSKKIHAVYGSDPASMARQLLEAANIAKVIPSGALVSLKPNLVVGRPAATGATTHPEILSGIVEYLFDHGHKKVEIIEGSWVGDDTGRAFAVCGMNDVAKKFRIPIYDLKHDGVTPFDTPAGRINVCKRALASDFLINLPVLKGHCQTRMTCCLKNMKGCIPDSEKRRFHRQGLDECIAALATAILPALNIVDGICGDLDFEEGGNPVQANRMLLGSDSVKIDAYVCTLMGLEPADIEHVRLAAEYGAGDMGLDEGDIVELNKPVVAALRPSGQVASLARGVHADQACSACYANLIHALKRGGKPRVPVYIGQGYKGQTLDGIGIGQCCRGASRAVPGCPPSALDIINAF